MSIDIIMRVKSDESLSCRPAFNAEVVLPDTVKSLMRQCWAEDPDARPDFSNILAKLKKTLPEW